jgi:hypothetical protein
MARFRATLVCHACLDVLNITPVSRTWQIEDNIRLFCFLCYYASGINIGWYEPQVRVRAQDSSKVLVTPDETGDFILGMCSSKSMEDGPSNLS